MDVGRSISYVFQDPAWLKKTLIGGVMVLIPIFGWFVLGGYFLRVIRQVYEGTDVPLPEWDDFGGDFIRGLKSLVVVLVWFLPVWVLNICVLLPLGIAGDSDNGAAGAAAGLSVLGNCLSFILSIIIGFVQPLFFSRLAITDSIGSALDFAGILTEARRVPVPLLIALGMQYALGIAAAVGLILCIIGVVFTSFLTYVMLSHLYGQIRRQVEGLAPAIQQPTY